MSSLIIQILLLLGVSGFVVWALWKTFGAGSPFILDPPDTSLRRLEKRSHKAIFLARWTLYACIWAVLVVGVVSTIIYVAISGNDYGEISDATVFVVFVLSVLGWLAVLWRRVSLKWPAALLAFALFPLGLLILLPLGSRMLYVLYVVVAVGLGKLIISLAGRRNVLAASQLKTDRLKIRPRGLVEALHDK